MLTILSFPAPDFPDIQFPNSYYLEVLRVVSFGCCYRRVWQNLNSPALVVRVALRKLPLISIAFFFN